MNASRVDIAVVGGGPVGAAAALALARAGFKTALIERNTQPAAFDATKVDARVYAVSPRSMEFLDGLGVWPTIAAARACPYRSMCVWVASPDSALRFDAADTGRSALGWIVEHGLIVDALWSALDAAGVAVCADAEIESVNLDGTAPSMRLADGRVMSARLIVAADGVDSRLRRAAGIETVAWAYAQRAIVCHVRMQRPHQATAWQRFLSTGPLAFLPLADGRCSIVWSVETAQADELMALDDAAFRQRLAEAGQVLGAVTENTHRVCIPLRLLHATEYARRGLVLVGDAAHSVHPMAGQGVNLGFADVAELAGTLAVARDAGRNWAGRRALARYARARKADNLDVLALTDALYRGFRAPLPGLRPALAVSMDALNGLAPLKGWLARRAVG